MKYRCTPLHHSSVCFASLVTALRVTPSLSASLLVSARAAPRHFAPIFLCPSLGYSSLYHRAIHHVQSWSILHTNLFASARHLGISLVLDLSRMNRFLAPSDLEWNSESDSDLDILTHLGYLASLPTLDIVLRLVWGSILFLLVTWSRWMLGHFPVRREAGARCGVREAGVGWEGCLGILSRHTR